MERFVLMLVTLCLACYLGQQPTKAEDTESLVERLLLELLKEEVEDEPIERRTETLGKRYTSPWDGYMSTFQSNSIDQNGVNMDRGAIIGQDGSKWTSDDHELTMKITAEEAEAVAECFRNKDFAPFRNGGIVLEGVTYQMQKEGRIVLGEKTGQGAVTLQATRTAIVIGHTAEGMNQDMTNLAVGYLAEYLEHKDL